MVIMTLDQYEEDYNNGYEVEGLHSINQWSSSFNEFFINNSENFFVEGIDSDLFGETFLNTLSVEKRSYLDRERPKTIPNELLENYRIIERASEQNPLKVLSNTDEQMAYIKEMEIVYQRTTQQHIQYMKEREYEGNVDERTWYRLALLLKRNNMLPDLEV